MYVNAKVIPVETVPGIEGRGMKESSGGGEFKYDILDTLNRCKYSNVPSPSTTIIKKRMMEGVDLTKICCKHFCKCHNVPPVQQ
jgi:hypothetical protein